MKKFLLVTLLVVLSLSFVGCEETPATPSGDATDAKIGAAYFNAHSGAFASAVAVVDGNGKILNAYLDDVFYRNLNQGYVGLPGTDSTRITNYLVNPANTLTSKKNQVNSDLYGANMAKAGSTVLPADNLKKIEEFAKGKTIAELEAVVAKDAAVAKEEIQAATGATFTDNQNYLNTILLAAKNAQASEKTFKAGSNVALKQAYYDAHGSPAIATAAVEGDKIVAAYIDEIYFFANDGKNVVFEVDAEKSLPVFVEGNVVSSKKTNGDVYGATLPGGKYVDQIAAIEAFVAGKTVAQLEEAITKLSADGAVVADVVSGATIRDTKGYIKAVAIAVNPSLANGDAKAQVVKTAGITKLGLGHIVTNKSTEATADAPAKGSVDTVVAVVALDKTGKVVKSTLDVIQASAAFDAKMQITSDIAAPVQTKVEKGDAYGMKKASQIGKEWYEQAAEFEKWAVGKSLDQIKGIAVDETGHVTDADLAALVTVGVTDYIAAYEEAFKNAVDVKTLGGTQLGLGHDAKVSASKGLDEAAGTTPVFANDITLAATLYDNTGKITATYIDTLQLKVNFDKDGKITGSALESKIELGDRYAMGAASSIGKNWDAQIVDFGKYIVGKTAEEVTALPLDEEFHATDADLISAVTIKLNSYLPIVAESYANVK